MHVSKQQAHFRRKRAIQLLVLPRRNKVEKAKMTAALYLQAAYRGAHVRKLKAGSSTSSLSLHHFLLRPDSRFVRNWKVIELHLSSETSLLDYIPFPSSLQHALILIIPNFILAQTAVSRRSVGTRTIVSRVTAL